MPWPVLTTLLGLTWPRLALDDFGWAWLNLTLDWMEGSDPDWPKLVVLGLVVLTTFTELRPRDLFGS